MKITWYMLSWLLTWQLSFYQSLEHCHWGMSRYFCWARNSVLRSFHAGHGFKTYLALATEKWWHLRIKYDQQLSNMICRHQKPQLPALFLPSLQVCLKKPKRFILLNKLTQMFLSNKQTNYQSLAININDSYYRDWDFVHDKKREFSYNTGLSFSWSMNLYNKLD